MAKHSKFRDQIGEDSTERIHHSGGSNYLTVPDGLEIFKEDPKVRSLLDFIPYKVKTKHHLDRKDKTKRAIPGSWWYKLPILIHRNVGPNNITIICPVCVGKACPICKHRSKRRDKGAEKEELKEMNYSKRNLYLVVPRNHKDYEEVLHLWNISQYAFQDKLDEEMEEKEKYRDFPDPETGKTLKIRFKKQPIGKKDSFNLCSRIDFIKRDESIDEELLEDVPCLDTFLNVLPYEEIESLFFGDDEDDADDDDDDDDDDEDEDDRRHKKSKKSKKSRDDDDDDDDDSDDDNDDEEGDEDEDDDEDEEKKSSKKSKSKKSRRHSRDDDEDDDDDDEDDADDDDDDEDNEDDDDGDDGDDDEKPSKSKSKKSKKDKCPHGLRFGKDHEKKKFCAKCKFWEKCLDAKE